MGAVPASVRSLRALSPPVAKFLSLQPYADFGALLPKGLPEHDLRNHPQRGLLPWKVF
jgi:hypothetical protein